MNALPESLRVKPNLAHKEMTLAQLQEEYDYWTQKIKDAPGWGAALTAANEFRRMCLDEMAMKRQQKKG